MIGADGINSLIRSVMRTMVLDAEGAEENPFEAKFMSVYGDAPRPPDIKRGMVYDIQGTGRASSLFVLRDRAQFSYIRDSTNRIETATSDLRKTKSMRMPRKEAIISLRLVCGSGIFTRRDIALK